MLSASAVFIDKCCSVREQRTSKELPLREAGNKTNQTYFVTFRSGVYCVPKLCECLIGVDLGINQHQESNV